jgi:hypothetical protein
VLLPLDSATLPCRSRYRPGWQAWCAATPGRTPCSRYAPTTPLPPTGAAGGTVLRPVRKRANIAEHAFRHQG